MAAEGDRRGMLDKSRFLYVEWLITYGCNFRCPYCFFGPDNLRKNAYMWRRRGPRLAHNPTEDKLFRLARKVGVFDYADAIRNYPVEKWQALFSYLATFKRDLYLSFTGGEPLILEKPIVEVLNHVAREFDKVLIRFDTNGSLVPKFEGLDPRVSVTFNVSYHPSQISRDKLMTNLDRIRDKGKVHMVNRVFGKHELAGAFDEIRFFADRGYFLNFSPESFDVSQYDEADLKLMRRLRTDLDVDYPILEQTTGKSCGYPTFGFQLLPNGYAWVPPCDTKSADVINKPSRIHRLLKKDAIACPGKCVCFHQYPWTSKGYDAMDIMGQYVARNAAHRARQLAMA
jgi:MoaA/NifB/PqqE/SkfB family radical SAM enzyme